MQEKDARHGRYPGTRPFGDTEADHKVFFGREKEASDLFNQVLSSDLVLLYGGSGVGKTSLLRAGLFPLLRRRDFLPLPVFVTQQEDGRMPLLEVCWTAIQKSCDDQKIKCTSAEKTGLWEFFKTAIFLKGAEPQEPVLVFDQFESIFHVYDREGRRAFAQELGELLGRTPPERVRTRQQAGEQLHYSDAPPRVKVLLTINEDHLGSLQEFAEFLPGILRNRFRLVPLERQQAEQAIVEPARLKGEEFLTPPFQFTEAAVKEILDFLVEGADEVNPLALQVLCYQVERKVANKLAGIKPIEPKDLGDHAGLGKTLRDFYVEAVRSLRIGQRRKMRRLCAEALVSQDRRRLLIHHRSLAQTHRVAETSLDALTEMHVLRQVQHLGSAYYELSCDVLVPAVLKERPWPSDKWKNRLLIGTAISTFILLIGVLELLRSVGVYEARERQAAQDYVEMFESTDARAQQMMTDQESLKSVSPSEALENSLVRIIELCTQIITKPTPAKLEEKERRKVYQRTVLTGSKALTLGANNRYLWKGDASQNSYDQAVRMLAAGTAVSLDLPFDRASGFLSSELDDDQVRAQVLALLTPEKAKGSRDWALALKDAYESRASLLMTVRHNLGAAEKDMEVAKGIAQRLPAGDPYSAWALYTIELELADLDFERGHLSPAWKAYEGLTNSPITTTDEWSLGQIRQRIGDVYLENLELDRATQSFQSGSDNFRHSSQNQPENLSTVAGRNRILNEFIFDERLGTTAVVGYDQASAILAHESARARLFSADRKRIIPQEFLQSAEKGKQLYNNVFEKWKELNDRDKLYSFRIDLVGVETELGAAMAALRDPGAGDMLRSALKSAHVLDDEVNKQTPENGEAPRSENAEAQAALVDSLIELGKFDIQEGNFEEGEEQYKSANMIAEYWKKTAPGFIRWEERFARIHDGLGDIYLSRKDLDKARKSYRDALEIREGLTRPETSSGKRMLDLAVSEYKLASLEAVAGSEPKIIDDHRDNAVAILRQLRDEGRLPPIAQAWPEVFGHVQ